MEQGLIVRLRPAGPWRFGSDSGATHEAGDLFHSDSVYSAVTHTLGQLGELDTWLRATAETGDEPAVRFSSCFPWLGNDLYIVPPRNFWPPSSPGMLGLRSARFVPVRTLPQIFRGEELPEDRWTVDAPSRCLVPSPRRGAAQGPFRPMVRHIAAVDRLSSNTGPARRIAGVEFAANAGLWLAVSFANEAAKDRWAVLVEAAFRMLADSGLGGRRSAGWGRFAQPDFQAGSIAAAILPAAEPKRETPAAEALEATPAEAPEATPAGAAEVAPAGATEVALAETTGAAPAEAAEVTPVEEPAEQKFGHWMLSLFHPSAHDAVSWDSGSYSLVTRGGRVESPAGAGGEKKLVRMVAEGSVLVAGVPPIGSAANVAPDGFPHPVYRYGRPVTLPVPLGGAA